MASPVPASLKAITPYLKHAAQLKRHDPLMSYYCRCYAVQKGIELRGASPDEENKRFLLHLMDELDKDKAELSDKLKQPGMQTEYIEKFAFRVFLLADNEDRAGNATRTTARNFYASAIFLEVAKQFGDLPPEIEDKRKYAKWKAADIISCLNKGLKPNAGPPGDNEENSTMAMESSEDTLPTPQQFPSFSFPKPPGGGGEGGGGGQVPVSRPPAHTDGEDLDFPSVPSASTRTTAPPAGSDMGFPSVPSSSATPPQLSFPSPPSFPSIPAGGAPPQITNNINTPPSSMPTTTFTFPTAPSFPTTTFTFPSVPSAPSSTPSAPSPPQSQQPPQQGDIFAMFPAVPPKLSSSPAFPSVPSSSAPPPSASQPQQPPAGSRYPDLQHGFPSAPKPAPQQQLAPQPQPQPQQAPRTTVAPQGGVSGYAPSSEALASAQKYAKFAASALQFDDIPYAVSNLQQALFLLTGKKYE